jgi:hypothetical protein
MGLARRSRRKAARSALPRSRRSCRAHRRRIALRMMASGTQSRSSRGRYHTISPLPLQDDPQDWVNAAQIRSRRIPSPCLTWRHSPASDGILEPREGIPRTLRAPEGAGGMWTRWAERVKNGGWGEKEGEPPPGDSSKPRAMKSPEVIRCGSPPGTSTRQRCSGWRWMKSSKTSPHWNEDTGVGSWPPGSGLPPSGSSPDPRSRPASPDGSAGPGTAPDSWGRQCGEFPSIGYLPEPPGDPPPGASHPTRIPAGSTGPPGIFDHEE